MRNDAITHLSSLGLDRTQLEFGSMPGNAMGHVALAINAHLSAEQPVYALHIGNFVGVSLACLTATLVARHPDSLVVAIDPNLPHRGIDNPQQYVIHLLNHFGLSNNVLLLTGFSHNPTPPDDGIVESSQSTVDSSQAPSGALAHLIKLLGLHNEERRRENEEQSDKNQKPPVTPESNDDGGSTGNGEPHSRPCERFHLALIDGHHEEGYVLEELALIDQLLLPGGLLVVDDVSETWHGVQAAFDSLATRHPSHATGYKIILRDGRIGIAAKRQSKE